MALNYNLLQNMKPMHFSKGKNIGSHVRIYKKNKHDKSKLHFSN